MQCWGTNWSNRLEISWIQKKNYHCFIPVTVHRPHRLISLRICPKILGNLALLDSVDRKFCSTSRVTKCSANFLTTSSYCTVLASESHTKHKLKIRKLRGYFSSEMRTGYPVGGKIKSQNDSTLYTYFPSKTCYLVPKYIHGNDTTVQLLFGNDVNTNCIKYFFGNIIFWHLINIEMIIT